LKKHVLSLAEGGDRRGFIQKKTAIDRLAAIRHSITWPIFHRFVCLGLYSPDWAGVSENPDDDSYGE
jgi:hypothetical protein